MDGRREKAFEERLRKAFAIPVPASLRPDAVQPLLEGQKGIGNVKRRSSVRMLPYAACLVIALSCALWYGNGLHSNKADVMQDTAASSSAAAPSAKVGGGEEFGGFGSGGDEGLSNELGETTAGGGIVRPEGLADEGLDGGNDAGGSRVTASRGEDNFIAEDGRLSVYDAEGVLLASAGYGDESASLFDVAFFGECVAVAYENAGGQSALDVYIFDTGDLIYLRTQQIDGRLSRITGGDRSLVAVFSENAGGQEREVMLWMEDGALNVIAE